MRLVVSIVLVLVSVVYMMSGPAKAITKNVSPLPVYFFSHGGPTFMYDDNTFGSRGAYQTVQRLGQKIKREYKPDYIIVVLAHYESMGRKSIEIATPAKNKEENDLYYDFYGFPQHMYKEEFHAKFDYKVGSIVKQQLEGKGFDVQFTQRGLDHGVWVPFKVAFLNYNTLNGNKVEEDLPGTSLIQVSLTGGDVELNFKLGEALSYFRDNLIWDQSRGRYLKGMVICSGMTVHNLRDIRSAFQKPGITLPYVKPFDNLLRDTLVNNDDLLKNLKDLPNKHESLFYRAHPSPEHFMPIVVASGLISASKEPIKQLFTAHSASLAWGIYQFGS